MAGTRPTEIDLRIAERVTTFRKRANLTQRAVADFLGISYAQYQKYEAGKNCLKAGMIQQIAILLNVPIHYFFDGALDVIPHEALAKQRRAAGDSHRQRRRRHPQQNQESGIADLEKLAQQRHMGVNDEHH